MINKDMLVLAMYDIRGKQKFIFNVNRIKEIAGASFIIRDCFDDYLYPAAMELFDKGIYHEDTEFSLESLLEHLEEGYIGETVYNGGGNFFVIFKDEETFKDVTYLFTKKILDNVGSLQVIATCIGNLDFDNYATDRNRLYQKHRTNEGIEGCALTYPCLPIVQIDNRTSMPLTDLANIKDNNKEKVSKESAAKYRKYYDELHKMEKQGVILGPKLLDELVEKKGEDSLLAVIYIDGNNMGAKVEACLQDGVKKYESYKDCISALRKYSSDIQKDYIDDRIKDIDACLESGEKDRARRLVINAGDEINIICNAHDAYKIANCYLKGLPENASSCAGIAIFHSHAPYYDAYRIAEECCESGKNAMKRHQLREANLIDFHYCQSAVGVSLDEIRKIESDINISRPWMLSCKDNKAESADITKVDDVSIVLSYLKKIGRTNVKGLVEKAKQGIFAIDTELKRIDAHMSDECRNELADTRRKIDEMDSLDRIKIIYDLALVYDLWFAKEEGKLV